MSTAGELACTYACLILNDDSIPITADKISALIKAANVPVESYWPALFAKFAEKRNIEDLIVSVGTGGGDAGRTTGGGVVVGSETPAEPAAKEEKKKEEEAEESDDEPLFSLFD